MILDMKKLLLFFFIGLFAMDALAYNAKVDDIYYTIVTKAKTAEVTYGDSPYVGEIQIPESILFNEETYTVTVIGNDAFKDCTELSKVSLPNTITRIGDNAFFGCTNLSSIILPNAVVSIGDNAFQNCFSLSSIAFPNSVTSMGRSAFYECHALQSVTIGNGLKEIGEAAFYNCGQLKFLEIPANIETIRTQAFYNCTNLETLILTEGIAVIESGAFGNCSLLKSLDIPESVKEINYAFTECTALETIHVKNLSSYLKIYFSDYMANPMYYANHLFVNDQEVEDLIIPDDIETLQPGAFYGCTNLKSIKFSDKLYYIGNHAFENCINLSSIQFPFTVRQIGECAFKNCWKLETVAIYNSVLYSRLSGPGFYVYDDDPNYTTTILASAFEGCSTLKTVRLGNGVTNIGSKAFSNCINLGDMYCYTKMAPYADIDAFSGSYIDYASLHIVGDIEDFMASETWSGFGTIVGITDNSTNLICDYDTEINGIYYKINSVFTPYGTNVYAMVVNGEKYYSGDIEIPNSIEFNGNQYEVKHTGAGAFQLCPQLESLTLPETMQTVPSLVFCRNLKKVILPQGLTTIGATSFYGCEKLSEIDIPSSVAQIGSSAFYDCKSLKQINLFGVTSIDRGAFVGCEILEKVKIGKNATTIESYAFGSNAIKDIYCYGETPATCSYEAGTIFSDEVKNNAVLHVPAQSIEKYKATLPWSEFKNVIALTENETAISSLRANEEEYQIFNLNGLRTDSKRDGIVIMKYAYGKAIKRIIP